MKSGKTYLGLILITFYLFFPGNGLALANHFFHDRGLPLIECPCCSETEKNSADNPLSENEGENHVFEHGCNCSSHLPSGAHSPESANDFACLLPGEVPLLYPMIYIPIFVPPQNLV
jgi:hypothetical protein